MILRYLLLIVRNLAPQQQLKQEQNKHIKSNKFVGNFVLYCVILLLFNNFIQTSNAQQNNEVLQTQQQQYSHEETNDKETEEDIRTPEEIQKAVCTVTAGEVRASAEAVTTKQLKGVCGSTEMHLALNKLEMKIFHELQELKSLLLKHAGNIMREESTTSTTPSTIHTSKPQINMPMIKSLNSNLQKKLQREDEVKKFNNTLLADRDIKLFTYYWKLENFSAHIGSTEMHELDSPIFTIKGKPLQIKAHFQHFQRDFLFLQLQYATLHNKDEKNNHNKQSAKNIWMEMGMSPGANSLFKQINSDDKIEFKHKISILDQHNHHSKDLVSQEFNNLDNGLFVPNSALVGTSPYIKQDALLIQIFLYL